MLLVLLETFQGCGDNDFKDYRKAIFDVLNIDVLVGNKIPDTRQTYGNLLYWF